MRLRILLLFLSTLTLLASAAVTYALRVQPGDPPAALSRWFIENRPLLALGLLVIAVTTALLEWIRFFTAQRTERKTAIQRVVDDFAETIFKGAVRQNRVTVFRAISGWKVWRNGLAILHVGRDLAKWQRLWRVKTHATYLSVYVRAAASRYVSSATALQVSDDPAKCEGVAGRVWEEGLFVLTDAPPITPEQVRATKCLSELSANHPVRIYAERTNVAEERLTLLRSMQHLGHHFCGSVIKRRDGTLWGVLLVDSDDASCPLKDKVQRDLIIYRLSERARLLGLIVA